MTDDGRIVTNHKVDGRYWARKLAREARDRQLAEQAAQRSRFEVRRILTGISVDDFARQEEG